MSSIATAVFKATIGLLVNKGRDKAAEILKDGDVTDQKFRALIVREIDDIKSKLDALSRKDLEAGISFFEEGIELLYEVFDKARSRSEHGTVTPQVTCDEAFSLAEGMRNLELTGLDESATRKLSSAKKRFEDARREATRAFKNESLKTSDRLLAMQYRVMATILETVDNPADAVAPCRVCVKELNCLPAVQNSFDVQLKKGIQAVRGLFSKEERREIITSVCHVNRTIYDVTLAVGEDTHLWIWPPVDTGENKVDPLRDERVAKALRKQGMEHCCVTPWSFGQEGEEEHKLKDPRGIATNSSGQFIVPDFKGRKVKLFDSSGNFVKHFSLPTDDVNTELFIEDVATDMNDNIYVLARLEKPGTWRSRSGTEIPHLVYKFTKTAELHHKFLLREGEWRRLSISDMGKVLVVGYWEGKVDEYETDGQFVRSFGEGILNGAWDITAANDGRVMVVVNRDDSFSCVHIFSEDGDHVIKFHLQRSFDNARIAFHRASEHVIVADVERKKHVLHVEIYTKDGEFVRSTQIHEKGIDIDYLNAITVNTEGRIAVVIDISFERDHEESKVFVL